MTVDMWEGNSVVHETLTKLIANYHPDLALVSDQIAIIFKEKSTPAPSAEGEVQGKKRGRKPKEDAKPKKIVYGKAKKAPAILSVLGKKNYVYILEINANEYNNLNDKQKVALFDHLLCSCHVEFNEETGDPTYSIGKPDFSFFIGEIQRHGIWQDIPIEDNAADLAATKIEELFKPKE
jgi:hypothetical protein